MLNNVFKKWLSSEGNSVACPLLLQCRIERINNLLTMRKYLSEPTRQYADVVEH